jgi:hypothetical protein
MPNLNETICTDAELLLRTLKRFSKVQLLNFVEKWTKCSKDDVKELAALKSKNSIAHEINSMVSYRCCHHSSSSG